MLVIEDIDRLDIKSIIDLFRTLKKSMLVYFENYVNVLEHISGRKIEEKETLSKKILYDRKMNFRDVHVKLDKIVNRLLDEM